MRTLKQELESRPRSDELEKKQQQCDSLNEHLATLRIEADELRALNDRCQDEMERMENELLKQKNMENEKHSAMAALHKQEAFSVEEVAVGKAEEEAVPTKAIEVASVETQTEVEELVVLSADVSECDVSICSNLGELDEDDDDDEEDDDEKTETIDTTEIFVGQKLLQLNESGLETTDSATSNSHSISISSSPNDSNLSLEGETTPVTVTGGGEPNGSILERVENLPLESSSIEHELELINHPDVQREEELIAFKEKYTHLTQENIRLNQQLQKLSDDFSHFKSKSVMNLLMYIAPVIVIIGYLLFNRVVS